MAQYIQIWNKTLRRSRFQTFFDWLDILWSLFHLFVLDRLIGDARWGGRLLGIVGGGQSQRGGGDKKKEKSLKDGRILTGASNPNPSTLQCYIHDSVLLNKIRQSAIFVWFWKLDQNGDLSSNCAKSRCYLHGGVAEYGVEVASGSGSRCFTYISRADK